VPNRTRSGEPAAVVGVVIAGVVAMVVSPGRFDWWATMVGLTLVAVLWGYAHEPRSRHESAGLAAAITLALVYTAGAPIERWIGARISGEGESGDAVLVLWAIVAILTWAVLEMRGARTERVGRASVAQGVARSGSDDPEGSRRGSVVVSGTHKQRVPPGTVPPGNH
jgi:hypothetical protein